MRQVREQSAECRDEGNGLLYIAADSWRPSLFLLSALCILLCLKPAQAATYYISKSLGSDSNTPAQAQLKSSPWQHLPGMAGCTTGCAAIPGWAGQVGPGNGYTPAAGDQFILYGGDTWTNADLPMEWVGSGTGTCLSTPNSSCMYIGVDQSWYNSSVCGSSWCRPIFNGGGTAVINYAVIYLYGSYVTVDNIEVKGFGTSGGSGGSYIALGGNGSQVVEHCYLHGWFHGASGDMDNGAVIGSGSPNNIVHDTIIDGSDTTQDMMAGIFSGLDTVYNSVIQYVTNGFEGSGNNWHDNYIAYIEPCYSGCHQNAVFNFGPNGSATSMFIYNNVIAHVWQQGVGGAGGGLWLSGNDANTATGYAFNNVMFDNQPGFGFGVAGHFAENYGTWYAFNNTIECGTDTNLCANGTLDGGGATGMTFVLYFGNNHLIGSTASDWSCEFSACSTPGALKSDVAQTLTTANSQGYTSTSAFAFQPMSGSGSTVGAGGNAQSICTTIASLNATAGAACQSDTGYACTYNTTNHTVSCPDRTEVARPASGPWDIGAYQYCPPGQCISSPPPPSSNTSSFSPHVYPNPWRSDRHSGNPVTFDGLTIGTDIKIFTVSGHKVVELHTDGPSVQWTLTNDSGGKVASGIYIYLITDSQGDKVRGKVAVIK